MDGVREKMDEFVFQNFPFHKMTKIRTMMIDDNQFNKI